MKDRKNKAGEGECRWYIVSVGWSLVHMEPSGKASLIMCP